MKEFSIYEDLQGDKLKDLLLFVTGISDKMSLARYYKRKLTQEQFNQIQNEYKVFIHEEDKRRRLYYKENGCLLGYVFIVFYIKPSKQ